MAVTYLEPRIEPQESPFIQFNDEVGEGAQLEASLADTVLLKRFPSARLHRHGSFAGFAPICLTTEDCQKAIHENLKQFRQGEQARILSSPGWLAAALDAGDVKPGECTLMVRNLPPHVTQKDVLQVLRQYGFDGTFDFLYLPSSFETGHNKGYGFINFISKAAAERLWGLWNNRQPFGGVDTSLLSVSQAVIQGLQANMSKWAGPRAKRVRNPNLRPYIRGHADFDSSARRAA